MEKKQDLIYELMHQYYLKQKDYVDFTDYIKRKLENLLLENDIEYQNITFRVKDVNSLKNKLEIYKNSLNGDIRRLGDLSGVRVILYDIELQTKIIKVLNENFIVEKNVAPRKNYDARNVTILLKDSNITKFLNMRCEVQIVGVLSHAVIESGHDVFYKDKEELKSKDLNRYEKLEKEYNKISDDAIKLETRIKLMKTEAENIKKRDTALKIITEEKYIRIIRASNNCSKIDSRIKEIDMALKPLGNSNDLQKLLIDRHLVLELVKAFVSIPNSFYNKNNSSYFGPFEWTYNQLIIILGKCINLWLNDLEQIISIITDYVLKHGQAQNNRLFSELSGMMVKVLNLAKMRGQLRICDHIFEWIASKPEEQMLLKLNIAIEYCDLDLKYLENNGYRQVKVCAVLAPLSKKYRENIIEIILTYCELYLKNKDFNLFDKLIRMCSKVQNCQKNFKRDCLLDFFNSHYKEIDAHVRWQLCRFGREQGEKFYNTDIYKKIKNDKICILYSHLYSYFLDDVPLNNFEITEEKRINYLKKYVEDFKEENEEEIIELCNVMDAYGSRLYDSGVASKFLYKIGRVYDKAFRLYERTQNIYILLGLYSRNEFKFSINQGQVEKILKCLSQNKEIFSEKLFMQALDIYEVGSNYKSDNHICSIILNDERLFTQNKYLMKLTKIINLYNCREQNVLELCSYLCQENQFIKILKQETVEIVFKNLVYKESLQIADMGFIQKMFEVYPNIVRNFIAEYVKNECANINYKFDFYPIYECKNIVNELENNILFSIELLEKNECYKVSSLIRNLIGFYSENVFNKLKVLIEQKKNINEIVHLLKILNVSISGWNAFELIIQNTDDKDILDEIDSMLFSAFGEGEYGVANIWKDRYKFFDDLCKNSVNKNKKVKRFIYTQKERFKHLYLEEENRVRKQIIVDKEIYNMSV